LGAGVKPPSQRSRANENTCLMSITEPGFRPMMSETVQMASTPNLKSRALWSLKPKKKPQRHDAMAHRARAEQALAARERHPVRLVIRIARSAP
jgi:hypothetical protein